MKSSRIKILGIIFLLALCSIAYCGRNTIKIFILRGEAMENYESNTHHFQNLTIQTMSLGYSDLTVESADTIFVEFSNADLNFLDSLYELQSTGNFADTLESLNYINLNSWAQDSIPKNISNHLKITNKVDQLWSITYWGSMADTTFLSALEHFDLDIDQLKAQLNMLQKLNCNRIRTHREGVELTYNKGLDMQIGCFRGVQYPIKYNIGTSYRWRKKIGNFKVLNKNVQCYASI